MAWQTELVRMVRGLINDLDSPYTYSDDRIQEVILISSQLILLDLDFANTYTVDLDQVILSPDPTTPTKDNAFINLVSLKSACMVDQWKLRGDSRRAIKVVDGKSSIDLTGILTAQRMLFGVGACKAFDEAKTEYLLGESNPGQAILGPFSSPTFLYYNRGGVYSHSREMFD